MVVAVSKDLLRSLISKKHKVLWLTIFKSRNDVDLCETPYSVNAFVEIVRLSASSARARKVYCCCWQKRLLTKTVLEPFIVK